MTKKHKEPFVDKVDQRMRSLTNLMRNKPAPAQWDMALQQAVYEVLLGNSGYRKIGQRYVINRQWIEQKTVNQVQNLAASGIRSYRRTLKTKLQEDFNELKSQIDIKRAQLKDLAWYQHYERIDLKRYITKLEDQCMTLQSLVFVVETLAPPIDLSKDTVNEAKGITPDQVVAEEPETV